MRRVASVGLFIHRLQPLHYLTASLGFLAIIVSAGIALASHFDSFAIVVGVENESIDAFAQAAIDAEIGPDAEVVTFDDGTPRSMRPGDVEDSTLGQGVWFEAVVAAVSPDLPTVDIFSNDWCSGTVAGGGLRVDGSTSKPDTLVRAHFVRPGTFAPALAGAVGVFTTTPDIGLNCLDYYDEDGALLGTSCAQHEPFNLPSGQAEFIGARTPGGTAYVDIRGEECFEVDLFSFVLVPADRIASLISDVQDLPLNKGRTNSLVKKLEAAAASIGRGNIHAAQNQLLAFINEAEAMIPKKLSESQAQALITEANAIWDQLNEQ